MDPDDPAAQDLRQRIERARTDAAIAAERARREAEEIELACAAFAAGSREEALGRLKAFVDHEPEAVAAAARLRRLEEETRRLEELERRLAQAAAQTRAAEEEAAQGWFARAVRLAESALMLDPDQPAALEVYVHAKARLCELTEIEARIAERHAGLERARDLVERRQLDEVVQIARRLVALDAEDEQATALALEVARLQWDAAVEAERRAVTAERVRVVRSALETAKATLVGRNWTSAADAAETVLGIEPQNPFALDVLRRAAAGRFGRPMPPAADDEPRELDQQIAVAGPMAPSWPRLKARVTEWAGVVRRRFQSQDGQTFTEWVMIAGLLTAICIMLLDTSQPTSIPGALIAVGRSISTYVRTMAP
ncbi:MAG: hypothetical protein HYX76_08605 [Acidobacteria bacterium]|nr:hypothetical protein [Acidobacteriota bacterium]